MDCLIDYGAGVLSVFIGLVTVVWAGLGGIASRCLGLGWTCTYRSMFDWKYMYGCTALHIPGSSRQAYESISRLMDVTFHS